MMTPDTLADGRAGRRPPRLLKLLAALALCGIAAGGAPKADAAGAFSARHGVAVNLGADEVDMSALPPLSALDIDRMRTPPRPRGGVDEQTYAARKAAAARGFMGAPGSVGPEPTRSGGRLTPGLSLGFAGQSENGSTPSDMALAVNKDYVVQVVNSSIAVYNHNTGGRYAGFPKALSKFFPGTSGDLGDPRAFFDSTAGRFVVEADDFTDGVVHIAVSQSSNATAGWWLYSFAPWGAANCRASGAACPDFPQIGFDDKTLYVGVNLFNSSGSVSDWILLLPKAVMYSGGGFSYNFHFNLSWGGVLVDTVQPVTFYGPREHPRAGFGVNSFNINFGGGQCGSGCNGLLVWAFSNNLIASGSPGPEISAVEVPTATTYSLPAGASEPGCAFCVDTGDVRISATPTYHAGLITASLNTNGSDHHSHALWFQLRPFLNDNDARCAGGYADACPQVTGASLVNEDCFFCGGQGTAGSSFYGALAPDDAGDLIMVYDFADNNTYPESAYTSRRVTQAQNTMHDAGFVLCGGGGEYLQGRWGDFNATAVDGSSPAQDYMWFAAQNSMANGNWGTCIGKSGFTAQNQP